MLAKQLKMKRKKKPVFPDMLLGTLADGLLGKILQGKRFKRWKIPE